MIFDSKFSFVLSYNRYNLNYFWINDNETKKWMVRRESLKKLDSPQKENNKSVIQKWKFRTRVWYYEQKLIYHKYMSLLKSSYLYIKSIVIIYFRIIIVQNYDDHYSYWCVLSESIIIVLMI